MKKGKTKLRPLYKALVIILSILLAVDVILTLARVVERIIYAPFYTNARIEFEMPGMSTGFVGQGLDYVEEADAFISCGYDAKKGNPSMIYLTDKDGVSYCTRLFDEDGNAYTSHAGGLTHYGDYVYVASSTGCDVFSLADVLDKDKAEIRRLGSVKGADGLKTAYINIHDGIMYMGSFYRAGNYETADWQHVTTPAGDENKAAIVCFVLDDEKPFGVNPTPVRVYSTRGLVQGITFTDDSQIILSCSYALAASHLYFYDISDITPSATNITLDGVSVPLHFLDAASLKRDLTAPPMSEEIVYKDGRIYIMTESASNMYIFGKFMSGTHLYSYAD